jgi:hypothetical protein
MTNHATPVVQVLVIEDDGDIRDYVHPMTGAAMFDTRSPDAIIGCDTPALRLSFL